MRKLNSKMLFSVLLIVIVSFFVSGCDFLNTIGQPIDFKTTALVGYVVDGNNAPLANIKVNIEGKPTQATTDINGKFVLANLQPGRIVVQMTGDKGTGQVVVNLEKRMPAQTFHYPVVNTVYFLHINDLHGQINNFAKLAAYKEKLQQDNKDVFLLCAGDIFSGNPIVDQFSQKGYPMIALMNEVGVQAMTLGNHDFDYGQDVLKDRMAQANFPFLDANVKVTTSVIPQPKEYVTLTTDNDLKINVLGLLHISSSNGYPNTDPAKLGGLEFTPELVAADNYKNLGDSANIFVTLSHLGSDVDVDLTSHLPSLNLIIGGHSHTVIQNPTATNGVYITQAGSSLNYLGQVKVTLENGKVVATEGSLVDLNAQTDEDANVRAMIDNFNTNNDLQRVIGQATSTISGKEQLGDLMTDAMVDIHGLDMAFQNSGGIRISSIAAGDITLGKIYELEPFGNIVTKFNMTPAEIRSLLTYSLRYSSIDLYVSGITYNATIEGDVVSKIDLLDKTGAPLDESKTYVVGIADFVANSYKFTHADQGTSTYTTIADTIIAYIQKKGAIDYTGVAKRANLTVNGVKIADTEVALETGARFDGSHTWGNVITDAMRYVSGADIATFPGGSMNANYTVNPGQVTDKATLAALKYTTNLVTYGTMTGLDLKDFILARSKVYKNADVQVSGMKYIINLDSTGAVANVQCFEADGVTPIDDAKTYVVAFDAYALTNTYKLGAKVQNPITTTLKIGEIVVNYLKSLTAPLNSSLQNTRISIVKP